MQTICQKCGHGNLLGHLFCVQCGAKLDLSHVDEDMEDAATTQGHATILKVFLLIVLIVLLVGIGLAAWPQAAFDEKKLDNGSAGRVENTLIALEMVAQRPSGSLTTRPPIEQIDANAWLASAITSDRVKSMSVSFKRDRVTFRAVYTLGPYSLWIIETPRVPYSMEIAGKPEKGTLAVAGAQIGHLPLPGRAAQLVTSLMGKTLTGMSREKRIFERMSEIKVDEGQLTVTVTGKQ